MTRGMPCESDAVPGVFGCAVDQALLAENPDPWVESAEWMTDVDSTATSQAEVGIGWRVLLMLTPRALAY